MKFKLVKSKVLVEEIKIKSAIVNTVSPTLLTIIAWLAALQAAVLSHQ